MSHSETCRWPKGVVGQDEKILPSFVQVQVNIKQCISPSTTEGLSVVSSSWKEDGPWLRSWSWLALLSCMDGCGDLRYYKRGPKKKSIF